MNAHRNTLRAAVVSVAALAALASALPPAFAQNPPQNGSANGGAGDASQAQSSLGGALGGLLNAMGGALGGNQHVTPVDFRSLQALLPDSLPGMKRTTAGGATKQGMGVKTTSAQAEYQGAGKQTITISISDISGMSGVLDMADALPKDTDSANDEGYEKDVTVGGRAMHEKFTKSGSVGSLQAIVARRFEVDVNGNGIGMDALHAAMGHVDLAKLEAMKSQGVQSAQK